MIERRTVADRGPLSEELTERLRACMEDEWPLAQIAKTFGVSHRTMKKFFPDYSGMVDKKLTWEIMLLTKKVGL